MSLKLERRFLLAALCLLALGAANFRAQDKTLIAKNEAITKEAETNTPKPILESVLPKFYNPQSGTSINELIKRALDSNQELSAARLEIEKAKARLAQARLRPNPTLEFEQESGRLVGNGGDGNFTVGASLPIEIYGRRAARINFAQIEIQASEADVRNRERILVSNILTNYAEALGALRGAGSFSF